MSDTAGDRAEHGDDAARKPGVKATTKVPTKRHIVLFRSLVERTGHRTAGGGRLGGGQVVLIDCGEVRSKGTERV